MILAAYYHTLCAFLFATIAVVLMLLILLQRGRGVGLAGAFGGAGGATAFGAKTGDMLTWATIVGTGLMLTLTVVLNYVFVDTGPELGAGTPPAAAVPTARMPEPTPPFQLPGPQGQPVPIVPLSQPPVAPPPQAPVEAQTPAPEVPETPASEEVEP